MKELGLGGFWCLRIGEIPNPRVPAFFEPLAKGGGQNPPTLSGARNSGTARCTSLLPNPLARLTMSMSALGTSTWQLSTFFISGHPTGLLQVSAFQLSRPQPSFSMLSGTFLLQGPGCFACHPTVLFEAETHLKEFSSFCLLHLFIERKERESWELVL